jgi:hypothetical protein
VLRKSGFVKESGVDILLGFTPYVAFFVIMRIAAVEAAMWAAFAVAVLIALYGRWQGRSTKILEAGAVVLFAALAVFTTVAHWHWSLMAVRLAVDLGLLAIVLISIAIGRPFTMQYARERVAREHWQSLLFLAVNRRITWVWAGAFAALVIAHTITVLSLVPVWVDAVVTILAFGYASVFTARYPEKARKAARLARAA